MNLAGKVLARLREGGIPGLLERAQDRFEDWRDSRLDRQYGLQTEGLQLPPVASESLGEHLAEARPYSPIQIAVFRDMMSAAGVDPRQYLFVDLGSGKGRALILAAEYGFRRVLGVELVPGLCSTAARNLDTYRRARPGAPPIDIHCGDAATYPMPREDAVLFLYHPFGERVVRKVAANIDASLRAWPRKLVIAYRNPVHSEVFDAVRGLRATAHNRSFAIYR